MDNQVRSRMTTRSTPGQVRCLLSLICKMYSIFPPMTPRASTGNCGTGKLEDAFTSGFEFPFTTKVIKLKYVLIKIKLLLY